MRIEAITLPVTLPDTGAQSLQDQNRLQHTPRRRSPNRPKSAFTTQATLSVNQPGPLMAALPNLSLAALAQAYQNHSLDPETLLLELRQQALALADHNIFISLLSEADIRRYTNALKNHTPGSLPLYGIPFAIKDNIDLASYPTTAACPRLGLHRDPPADGRHPGHHVPHATTR